MPGTRIFSRVIVSTLCYAFTLIGLDPVHAGVSVRQGPTPIQGGSALAPGDLTVTNEYFAVSFAVASPPPWGVARGGIIDAAIVGPDGLTDDLVSLIDFMPNGWSASDTRMRNVEIASQSEGEVIVQTEREWGPVELITRYVIRAGARQMFIQTRMVHRGQTPIPEMASGYVIWPDGGHVFSLPGLLGEEAGATSDALARWSAFYDKHWLMGLHADYDKRVDNQGRDRWLDHQLAPGTTRSFAAWVQFEPSGETSPLVRAETARLNLPNGQLSGRVDVQSEQMPNIAVMAERITADGQHPFAWTRVSEGRYDMTLPAGQYLVYATAPGHGESPELKVLIVGGEELNHDFSGLTPPGNLLIKVRENPSGRPLDARIAITEGASPVIGYFGQSVFFTQLNPIGELDIRVAPGQYQFEVSSGGEFTSRPVTLDQAVESGRSTEVTVQIKSQANPAARGWYSADLHHHSDVLDGYTYPQFVLRAQLAAGLDFAFLSDHDSVVNNATLAKLAAQRGMPFIPATELSPSWAHFNAYPLAVAELDIAVERMTVQDIFAEARRLGAAVLQVNHPHNEYGYFEARDRGAIPGGFSAGFDVVEISSRYANDQTIPTTWSLWNGGKPAYFVAGSDVHDVWNERSGAVRTYAFIDGDATVEKYVESVLRGHSYASAGPIIYPGIVFGERVSISKGESMPLRFTLQSVRGLARVQLIERGKVIAEQTLHGDSNEIPVAFSVTPGAHSWYSLVVEDIDGFAAYSNPIWVEVNQPAGPAVQ